MRLTLLPVGLVLLLAIFDRRIVYFSHASEDNSFDSSSGHEMDAVSIEKRSADGVDGRLLLDHAGSRDAHVPILSEPLSRSLPQQSRRKFQQFDGSDVAPSVTQSFGDRQVSSPFSRRSLHAHFTHAITIINLLDLRCLIRGHNATLHAKVMMVSS